MMHEKKLGQDHQYDDVAGSSYGSAMIPLGENYRPSSEDVLVGRGKLCREWAGNSKFRELVASRLDDYASATSKLEKSAIVTSVLSEVRTKSPNGGFIKKDPLTGQWCEVGDFVARERVTQSFRDALHNKYRSSNTSKKTRRKEQLKKAKEDQLASPAKRAKIQHLSFRIPQEPPLPVPRSLLHGDAVPLMTPLVQIDSVLERSFNNSLNAGGTALPASSQLAPFDAAYARSTSDSLEERPLQQRHSLEQQSRAGDCSRIHLASLEQQMRSLQEQQLQQLQRVKTGHNVGQASPYPTRWFRVRSGGSPRLQGSMSPSINEFAATFRGNQHVPSLEASSNAVTYLPSPHNSDQAQASDGLPYVMASPPVNIGAYWYSGDDNPFEPVPLADSVSQRHSYMRQYEEQAKTESGSTFDREHSA